MEIELTKEDRALAIASLERYFNEHFAEALDGQRLGNIQAGALLNFFLEEVGTGSSMLRTAERAPRCGQNYH